MKFRSVALAISGALFFMNPAAAVAAPVKYLCELTSHSRFGWIPKKALYVLDEAAGKATAFDPYIRHVGAEQAKDLALKKIGAKRYSLKYTLNGLPAQGNMKVIATYVVRLNLKTQRVTLEADIHRADFTQRGTGLCKLIK